MPKKTFRDSMRSRTVAARRAADFGVDTPFRNDGSYYNAALCDSLICWCKERGFRDDILISIEAIARGVPRILTNVEDIMGDFMPLWGERHRERTLDYYDPDAESAYFVMEPGRIDFFAVAAPCEAQHANHGHIIVSQDLDFLEERKLIALGKECGLRITITRNSAAWLAKRKSVTQHACKIRYAVHHLRRRGSDYRMSPPEMPWIRRANATWAQWRKPAAKRAAKRASASPGSSGARGCRRAAPGQRDALGPTRKAAGRKCGKRLGLDVNVSRNSH